MRLLIIRHGDPNYESDCLTEKGEKEAKLLAEWFKKEKIDYFYSSPLGRAYQTCLYSAKEVGKEKEIEILPWLKEFPCQVVTDREVKGSPLVWDMLPLYWKDNEQMYQKDWYKQTIFQNANVEECYNEVKESLNALLAKHGYKKEGSIYKVENANTDTIALFCHFGLEMMLLSILMDISPVPLLHHFVAAPTSVTTLYTEERRKGIAVFRCASFGDTRHLYVGKEQPSLAARFTETYDLGDRID